MAKEFSPISPSILAQVREYLYLQRELGKKCFFHPIPEKPHIPPVVKPHENSMTRSLSNLRDEALKCTKCPLSKKRTQVVFGTGNPNAELMFVGEAPGFDEDREGEPFVGKAGQLLTKMIQAMGFKREDVYITNIVKCRPPENRNPHPEEIEQCLPYLKEQIQNIRPKVVCALGSVAAQTLLETEKSISRLRGMFYELGWYKDLTPQTPLNEVAPHGGNLRGGIKVMPTFHPAYLLRNPEFKREVWRDLQLVMEELNIEKRG